VLMLMSDQDDMKEQTGNWPTAPCTARHFLFASRHQSNWTVLKAGVSNTRLKGGMRPAGSLCAAKILVYRATQQIRRSFLFYTTRNVFLRGPSAISGICYPWMVTCSVREQRCRCSWMSLLLFNVRNVGVVRMYNKHSPYLLFRAICGPPCSSAIRWTTAICSAALSSYRQRAHCEQVEGRLTQRIMLPTAGRIFSIHPPICLSASLFFLSLQFPDPG
jgi:hypothetical protein